jgi:hypothetical protein
MAYKGELTANLSVLVTPELKATITRLADAYGLSNGDVVRDMLAAGLADTQRAYASTPPQATVPGGGRPLTTGVRTARRRRSI